MRVLDIFSGAGDVSLLAARLVGPTGAVVGVETNPDVVRSATERVEAAAMTNVRLVAEMSETSQPFRRPSMRSSDASC